MHEKYGMTAEQLIAAGKEICERNTFKNYPFWHYITVAAGAFQWDAITAYHASQHNVPDLIPLSTGYYNAGAFHMWHSSGGMIYSVIGLHYTDLNAYNPAKFIRFINSVTHEIQHALMANEAHNGIDSLKEEEPRAYATGVILAEVVRIINREWNVGIMAVPREHNRVIAGLKQLPASWVDGVSSVAAMSGIMHMHMVTHNQTVTRDEHGWTATTYFNGGEHV